MSVDTSYRPIEAKGSQLRGPLMFLGNFIHPPNIDAVAWWLDEISPEVESLCGQPIPLRVIGSASELLLEKSAGTGLLEVGGWVEDLDSELGNARVFIAPIRYGAGTKDKISIAMRYGIPTITTTVGAESMPRDLVSAMVVIDSPKALAAATVDLMTDDAKWTTLATKTRRCAQQAWNRQRIKERRFVEWFSRIAGC